MYFPAASKVSLIVTAKVASLKLSGKSPAGITPAAAVTMLSSAAHVPEAGTILMSQAVLFDIE